MQSPTLPGLPSFLLPLLILVPYAFALWVVYKVVVSLTRISRSLDEIRAILEQSLPPRRDPPA